MIQAQREAQESLRGHERYRAEARSINAAPTEGLNLEQLQARLRRVEALAEQSRRWREAWGARLERHVRHVERLQQRAQEAWQSGAEEMPPLEVFLREQAAMEQLDAQLGDIQAAIAERVAEMARDPFCAAELAKRGISG